MAFSIFIVFLVLQRLSELMLARRNERWARAHGAVEYGQAHYPWMVALHTAFVLSLIVEYLVISGTELNKPLLLVFGVLLTLKIWVVFTLGKYWNTKVLRVPGVQLVRKGVYKYISHPNYCIVVLEIMIIPLIFNLYYTAIIFSCLNAAMLYVRIRTENQALRHG
jgi:methyltransferase